VFSLVLEQLAADLQVGEGFHHASMPPILMRL
jgi:hypothetical protein